MAFDLPITTFGTEDRTTRSTVLGGWQAVCGEHSSDLIALGVTSVISYPSVPRLLPEALLSTLRAVSVSLIDIAGGVQSRGILLELLLMALPELRTELLLHPVE